jgi:hypothetical protein
MFAKDIALVIGAGASAELGFPTGASLKERIAKALSFYTDGFRLTSGDLTLHRSIQNKFGRDADAYFNASHELSNVMPSFVSIDEALHYLSARPEVVTVGKAAIVHEILRAERESLLFKKGDRKFANLERVDRSWLPHFLSMALSSHTHEDVETIFSRVTIINFNYDRSIEHFLYTALQRNAAVSEVRAKKIVSELRVIRPYGSIGQLWPQRGEGVHFGAEISGDYEALFSVIENIRTYTEQNLAKDALDEIQKAINSAKVVLLLGFGFHSQNKRLLQSLEQSHMRRAFATVYGIDEQNHELLSERVRMTLGCNNYPVRVVPWFAHEFMDKMRFSVMAAAS